MDQLRSPQSGLMTVKYMDSSKSIYLTVYADTVVYGAVKNPQYGLTRNMLCAIRFGGYPEQVNAMVAAIHGGGDVTVEHGGKEIILRPFLKRYRRNVSHDGVYAEATMIAEDEDLQANKGRFGVYLRSALFAVCLVQFSSVPPLRLTV